MAVQPQPYYSQTHKLQTPIMFDARCEYFYCLGPLEHWDSGMESHRGRGSLCVCFFVRVNTGTVIGRLSVKNRPNI
jgi:hypothetical protein